MNKEEKKQRLKDLKQLIKKRSRAQKKIKKIIRMPVRKPSQRLDKEDAIRNYELNTQSTKYGVYSQYHINRGIITHALLEYNALKGKDLSHNTNQYYSKLHDPNKYITSAIQNDPKQDNSNQG